MKTVKIKDKEFVPMISEEEIKRRVKELAAQISKDMAGKKRRFQRLSCFLQITVLRSII